MSYCASSCVCRDVNILINSISEENYNIIKEIFGWLACISSSIMFIPDIIFAIKTKGGKTITFKFMILFIISCIFWLIYGVLINSLSTIILELFLLCNALLMSILRCKYFYKKHQLNKTDITNTDITRINVNNSDITNRRVYT